ncbi:MAG: hypothetical protein IJC24_03310, partial [Clostridia bacterium]|nr:hypothetical protein [Clostridia bacterium]
MIAFYAVSNLAIFNAVNVKEQYYPDTGADLFVRFVNGTTLELVEAVRGSGIFENVFLINIPQIDTRSGFLGKFSSLRILGYGKKYQLFVDRYLDTVVPEKKYDVLLTLHMDSHCLYFADYFRRSNKRIAIEFFEDGTASYLCTKKYLTQRPVRLGESFKAYIGRCIYERPTRRRIRRNITNTLYIYAPEIYDEEMGFVPKKLNMGETCGAILK